MKRNIILGIILACVVVVVSSTSAAVLFNKLNVSNNLTNNQDELVEKTTKQDPIEMLNGWKKEADVWCFYVNNIKQTGWFQHNNAWYYLGEDGKMRTGWIKDKDQWYYLYEDGTMATNTTIDKCYINGQGLIEETPKPKPDKKETTAANTDNSSVINENEALNIIYRNDGSLISSFIKPKLEFTGMASSDRINYLNSNYENMNISEALYKFCIFEYGVDLNDYSENSDPVYIYYVGKSTRKVYRTSGHSLDHIYEIENNVKSKTHLLTRLVQ